MNVKKIAKALTLALVLTALLSVPVLAYTYSASILVTEDDTAGYTQLPIIASVDNQYLADNDYITASGLDTRVLKASTEMPWMVSTNKTLFCSDIAQDSQTNFTYTFGNTAEDDFPIVTGYGGYITIADDADLEFGGDLEEYSSTSDGYIFADEAVYNTAWTAASGAAPGGTSAIIGQYLSGNYKLNRAFFFFDTSSIPDNAAITSATLKLYGQTDSSATDFLITIQNGQPTYPSDPLVAGDYDKSHYSGDGGSLTTVGFSMTGYNDISLNATGLTWINRTGTTKLCVRSDREIAGTPPSGTEHVIVYATEQSGTTKDPQLIVNYSFPFEIEQSGYVDTDAGSDKNLVYKQDAFKIYISAAEEISAVITTGGVCPVVAAVNGGNDVVNQTNHTVNLPADISSGDLLLALFATDGTDAITFPEGWTELFQDAWGGVNFGAWYRVADGEEGATITVTTAAAQMTAHTTYRITGYSGVPEVGTSVTVSSANPDPPNLTPSWGSTNTLWFAVEGNGGNKVVTDYPTNYTNGRNDYANDFDGCGVGSTRRELNAASENPGTFTLSDSEQWVANTIAIAPVDLEVTTTGVSSGEYTVKTYGVANEPVWATGDVLHFTGSATSNVNCGAIHNASAKFWVSLWFKLDSDFSSASDTDQLIWGKYLDASNRIVLYLNPASGKLRFYYRSGAADVFVVDSTETSWNANQWYHIIASISDVAKVRLIVDNGTAVTDTDGTAMPNGGDFIIGDRDDPGAGTGFIGEIQNVIVGTDDLSPAEEAALYTGTAPGDETNYWYIDEGTGTTIYDYGTGGNDGTADTACSWETATYTTGSTGRLCDFYIEVDDDRWGANLKGASVPDNSNDWLLNQNDVMPWIEYYKHTVSDTLIVWYQPVTMVIATDYDGTADAGGDTDTIIDAELTQADDYWVGALVTITDTGDGAPVGETSICTAFADATDEVTVSPAFTAGVDVGDTYTIDFGTLIDREGTAQDGRITWGVNPTGVSVAVGGLESTGAVAPIAAEEPEVPDILPPTPDIDLFTESTGANIPLIYTFFKMTSDTTGIPIQVFWYTGSIVFAAVLGALALIYLHSMLIAAFATGSVVAVACTIDGGVISWWVLYIYVIMAVTFWIYQRVHSVS